MTKAERYIIDIYGKEWLKHDWEAGDVIDAIEGYESQAKETDWDKVEQAFYTLQMEPTFMGTRRTFEWFKNNPLINN